jgi:hypothetical protein
MDLMEEEREKCGQAEETEHDPGPEPDIDEPMLYCPVCSQRLTGLKCKLVCPQCGYYMSCADYY